VVEGNVPSILFDGNPILVDVHLDSLGLRLFAIDIAPEAYDDDNQCADDDVKTVCAIHF
jgi:hypothetical protein